MSEPSSKLMEKVQSKLKDLERKGKRFWTPEEGKNKIRILPSWKGADQEFYREVPTHYDVGPNHRTLMCPRAVEKKCPICDKADRLANSDSARKQARADDLWPSVRIMFNILDRKDPDGTPLVWSASTGTLEELLRFFADADYGDFTHPKEGFDVILVRKGKGQGTRYKVSLARTPSSIGCKGWKEKLHNLDKLFKPLGVAEIKAIMLGEESDYD